MYLWEEVSLGSFYSVVFSNLRHILSFLICIVNYSPEGSSQITLILAANKRVYLPGHWILLGYYSSYSSYLVDKTKEKRFLISLCIFF